MAIAERLRGSQREGLEAGPAAPWRSPATVLGFAVLAVLVTWFPHAWGGRSTGAAAAAALAVGVSLLAVRAWQATGRLVVGLLAWLAVAALLVALLTGGGRAAAVAATTYGLAAGVFLLTRALAADDRVREALVVAVAVGGILQFGWAFLPWWGSGDPAYGMVGTYYWKNQYAAALLAPAVLGLALAVLNRRPFRAAGWVAAPLSVTGVFLSGSRAALGLLVVGWLVAGALLLVSRENRRGRLVRLVAVSLLTVGVAFVLPGPPLFHEHRSPLAQTVASTAEGHLQSSGDYRLQVWTEALHVFAGHPWDGVGYGRVASAAVAVKPAGWPVSSLVHNGALQGMADGGLLLGLPLLLVLVLAGLALLRVVVSGELLRHRPLTVTSAVAGLMLFGHSMVDFDWSYPALAVITACVVGLGLPSHAVGEPPTAGAVRATRWLTFVLVGALAVGGAASWGEQFHINAPAAHLSLGDGK